MSKRFTRFLTGIQFAKAAQLDKVLKQRHASQMHEESLLREEIVKHVVAFWKHFEILAETLELLYRILENHRLGSQLETDQSTGEWLIARCEATIFKMKVIQQQCLSETYTSDTIPALKSIRETIISACNQAKREYDGVIARLHKYEQVGLGFKELADEYNNLLNEINQKKWALNELRKNSGSSV